MKECNAEGDVEGGGDGENTSVGATLCDCDMDVGEMDRFCNISLVSCLWSLIAFTCLLMFSPSRMVHVI